MRIAPGGSYEAVLESGISGLVGTVAIGLLDPDGDLIDSLLTTGITERPAGSGIYFAARTAPVIAGVYTILWSLDGTTDPDQVSTDTLTVTSSSTSPPTPGGRDLCVLEDVYGYIPGFDPDDDENADTVAKLTSLITARSRSIHQDTGREFAAIPGNDPRTFDLTAGICSRRQIPIGDAAEITQIELFDFDGTTSLGVVDPSLYILQPRVREEWEPVTRLKFPYRPASNPLLLAPGRILAITATWGFPSIPDDIVQACAALVITTALTDVAQAGTDLSDAVDPTFNVSGLIRWALTTIEGYSAPGFA